MRRYLLAGAAVIGSVGTAAAQAPAAAPALPPLPPPAWTAPTEGYPATGGVWLGGNNAINEDGTGWSGSPAQAYLYPTPGSMTIHLGMSVWGYLAVGGGSGYVNTTSAGTAKLAPDQITGYFRIYPGVDAMATNGLRYGAIVEIRQNFIGQGYGLNINAPSGTANNGPGGNFSTSPSGDSCASTLYVRREAVYIGSNQLGIIRLGQDDGPFSQLDNGITTQQYGTSELNGDAFDSVPSGASFAFPFWSGVGAEYVPSKLAYYSPQFYGFDFGASWAPNNGSNNASGCPIAAAGCQALISNPTGTFGGANRPINWVEIMGRYQNASIGGSGVGVYGIVGGSWSGHVENTVPLSQNYNGFSVGDAGVEFSYAGFGIGGNVLWGLYNGEVALMPHGGTPSVTWTGGVVYNNSFPGIGPVQAFATWTSQNSTGSTATSFATQRRDNAFDAGVNWNAAPGLYFYAEYQYTQSYQGGVNLFTGSAGSSYNNVHDQAFILGSRVKW